MRYACALALHAFEVTTGLEQGPFDQVRAKRFARALLMRAEECLAVANGSDVELAERFDVPVEQVPARRTSCVRSRTGACPRLRARRDGGPAARARQGASFTRSAHAREEAGEQEDYP